MKKSVEDEFSFIIEVSRQFKTHHNAVIVPNGDDAAVYRPTKRMDQVVCVDTMVEGVHFKRETMSPFQVGYKAVAVNISDIAAMGGIPKYFTVSIAIPPDWSTDELHDVYAGMKSITDEWTMDLLGGDTVSIANHLVITVTVVGEIEQDVRLLRRNAQVNDIVFVTDYLGHSAAGLDMLLSEGHSTNIHSQNDCSTPQDQLDDTKEDSSEILFLKAHQMPKPHVKQGRLLAEFANEHSISLNDVSDGIASEANEIAVSSSVDIILNAEQLPISAALITYAKQRGKDVMEWVMNGGEDFCLIGTLPERIFDKVKQTFVQNGCSIFAIGRVKKGNGQVWLHRNGKQTVVQAKGYNHFTKS